MCSGSEILTVDKLMLHLEDGSQRLSVFTSNMRGTFEQRGFRYNKRSRNSLLRSFDAEVTRFLTTTFHEGVDKTPRNKQRVYGL